VHIARSLPNALELISSSELSKTIENVHIIGGSSVYKVRSYMSCHLLETFMKRVKGIIKRASGTRFEVIFYKL